MNMTHFVTSLSEFVSELLCGIKPYLVKPEKLVNPCKPTCDKILVANLRGLLRLTSLPSHCSCPFGATLCHQEGI